MCKIRCAKCFEEKEETSFYMSLNGYHRYCKDCQREYVNMKRLGLTSKLQYYTQRKSEIEHELTMINKKIKQHNKKEPK